MKSICFPISWSRVLCVWLAAGALPVAGQSNLLVNPSFEKPGINPVFHCILNDIPDWSFGANSERCVDWQCPNGNSRMTFLSFLAQEVPTVPGRKYYLKFAAQAGGLTARFGNDVITTFTNIGGTNFYFGSPWSYSYCHVTAASNSTWLWLETANSFAIDDVLLGWLDEPLVITSQPGGVEALAGARLTLDVGVSGVPPISYQWHKDSLLLAGATNRLLYVSNVQPAQAGSYFVVVSNHVGSVTSQTAEVTVDTSPHAPQIVLHPESLDLVTGVPARVRVAAVGTAPLRYQWRFNGTNLPGATNATLLRQPLELVHAGVYQALVENQHGSTLSLPSAISVAATSTVLIVRMANGMGLIRNPIYDVNGTTLLTASNFLAQAYLGERPEKLIVVSPPIPFLATVAGLYQSQTLYLPFPNANPSTTVYLQVRVWEAAFGDSYEEARAQGGRIGVSPLIVTTGVAPPVPPPTTFTPSFNLRAGQPSFSTGRISRGANLPNGQFQWVLTGAAGFTYLIERRHLPNQWQPLVVLTNGTGTVTFTDPEQLQASAHFYRSRMLD